MQPVVENTRPTPTARILTGLFRCGAGGPIPTRQSSDRYLLRLGFRSAMKEFLLLSVLHVCQTRVAALGETLLVLVA